MRERKADFFVLDHNQSSYHQYASANIKMRRWLVYICNIDLPFSPKVVVELMAQTFFGWSSVRLMCNRVY